MVNDQSVLLYSGGMDSYIIKHCFDIKESLYVNMGTKYSTRELSRIDRSKVDCHIINVNLSMFEMQNAIIPFRNHILVMLAANLGNVIYTGFTLGDHSKDKDYVFKAQVEGILNYFSLDQDYVFQKGYPYRLEIPFKDYTKAQMVMAYKNRGNDLKKLADETWSCYSYGEKECGWCKPCLRKFVALLVNGYDATKHFQNNPKKKLNDFLLAAKAKNRGREVDDIALAIKMLDLDMRPTMCSMI